MARRAGAETRPAATAAAAAAALLAAQKPHEVRAVDDAAAGKVTLPEEATGGVGSGRGVDAKRKGRRQHVAPLVELVLQLGDNLGEPRRVRRRARVPRVQQLVHAVEQPAHADAGEEVERGLLLLHVRGVRVVGPRERDGGFDARDAGDGAGGELGDVVTIMGLVCGFMWEW